MLLNHNGTQSREPIGLCHLRKEAKLFGKLQAKVLALPPLNQETCDRAAPAAHRRSVPAPSAPLTVSNIPAFGVYFCRKPTLTALRRDGIHPTAHSEMSDLVYHSPLNQQRHGLYLFVNLPATLEAGFTWFMLDSQKGIIGTPKVPLPASFFHSALAIE